MLDKNEATIRVGRSCANRERQSPHDLDDWSGVAWFGPRRHRLGFGFAMALPGSILPAGSRPAGIGHEPSPVRQAIVGCIRPALTSTSGILPARSWSDGRDSDGPLLCTALRASLPRVRLASAESLCAPLEKADLPSIVHG